MGLAAGLLESQLSSGFDNVRWILDDVDHDDCFWEPCSPSWSVRPRGAVDRGWGTGDFVCEDAWPPPDPLPVTTIAWRIAHLAAWTEVYRVWTFEQRRLDLGEIEVPETRDGLVTWLCETQERFRAHVVVLEDADLQELRPAHWGPHLPVHRLVSTIALEHIHHGAEIGVLRDLRRGHARQKPPPVP